MNNLQPSHSLFHAFCVKSHTRFKDQRENEEVVLVIRAHPITLVPFIFNTIIFFILLLILNYFFFSFFSFMQQIFFDLFAILIGFNYFWLNFLNWYFNVGIVTDERIVDSDFNSLLYKNVTYTLLTHVEDVTASNVGYFSSFFNYGNVFVQTAGSEINTEFLNIPRPSDVAKIINELVQKKHGNTSY